MTRRPRHRAIRTQALGGFSGRGVSNKEGSQGPWTATPRVCASLVFFLPLVTARPDSTETEAQSRAVPLCWDTRTTASLFSHEPARGPVCVGGKTKRLWLCVCAWRTETWRLMRN